MEDVEDGVEAGGVRGFVVDDEETETVEETQGQIARGVEDGLGQRAVGPEEGGEVGEEGKGLDQHVHLPPHRPTHLAELPSAKVERPLHSPSDHENTDHLPVHLVLATAPDLPVSLALHPSPSLALTLVLSLALAVFVAVALSLVGAGTGARVGPGGREGPGLAGGGRGRGRVGVEGEGDGDGHREEGKERRVGGSGGIEEVEGGGEESVQGAEERDLWSTEGHEKGLLVPYVPSRGGEAAGEGEAGEGGVPVEEGAVLGGEHLVEGGQLVVGVDGQQGVGQGVFVSIEPSHKPIHLVLQLRHPHSVHIPHRPLLAALSPVQAHLLLALALTLALTLTLTVTLTLIVTLTLTLALTLTVTLTLALTLALSGAVVRIGVGVSVGISGRVGHCGIRQIRSRVRHRL